MPAKMTLVKDLLPKIKEGLARIEKQEVLVGIPAESPQRKDEKGPMNNATLAYIHDNGSPAANIPARPFMRPGIMLAKEKIANTLGAAAVRTLEGGNGQMSSALHKIGLIAQASVREVINEGVAPPLADSTLKARARRGRKGAIKELKNRAEGLAAGMGDAKPLVDTGQMRNAISYVVREKK